MVMFLEVQKPSRQQLTGMEDVVDVPPLVSWIPGLWISSRDQAATGKKVILKESPSLLPKDNAQELGG